MSGYSVAQLKSEVSESVESFFQVSALQRCLFQLFLCEYGEPCTCRFTVHLKIPINLPSLLLKSFISRMCLASETLEPGISYYSVNAYCEIHFSSRHVVAQVHGREKVKWHNVGDSVV